MNLSATPCNLANTSKRASHSVDSSSKTSMNLSATPCNLAKTNKSEVREYFLNSYNIYEELFKGIKDEEAFYLYPDALRLPLIFYYGHTAAVYINKLTLAGLIKDRVNFEYESLFETGVDEMSWDDIESYRMGDKLVWPSLDEVQKYRDEVRDLILDLIDNEPMTMPVTQDSPWWSLFMGMEHERIHLETSSVLIRQLPIKYVEMPPNWVYGPQNVGTPLSKNSMLKVHNTTVTVGKPYDFPSYGWDNEYGQWTVRVPEFEASKYLISNREFLDFVRDDGYHKKQNWSEEGWHWRSWRQAKHPTFWVCEQGCKSGCGNDLSDYSHCCLETDENKNDIVAMETNNHQNEHVQYKYRATFDVIEMPLDWPVEVNHYEAKAFCAWKGPDYRLLTEAEHHAIRGPQKPVSMGTESDAIHKKDFKANINLKYASSTPVNWFPENEAGFHDVFGNVWCWVEDHFNGLPGFKSHYLYDDFSTPTFDGQHFMIMGGSWVATGDEASRFARYGFRPHFFQHLGFRLARSVTSTPPPVRLIDTQVFVVCHGEQDNPSYLPGIQQDQCRVPSTNYQFVNDTADFLSQEIAVYYNDMDDEAPGTFIDMCIDYIDEHNIQTDTALSLLCSVGRDAFELTKRFTKIVGVDFSGRAIDCALKLQKEDSVNVGKDHLKVKIPKDVFPDRVVFKQLTWLPNEIGKYDFISLSGLERFMCPKAWLVRMREILNPDGVLAIKTCDGLDRDTLQSYLGELLTLVAEKPVNHVFKKKEGLRSCDRCHSSFTFWSLVNI